MTEQPSLRPKSWRGSWDTELQLRMEDLVEEARSVSEPLLIAKLREASGLGLLSESCLSDEDEKADFDLMVEVGDILPNGPKATWWWRVGGKYVADARIVAVESMNAEIVDNRRPRGKRQPSNLSAVIRAMAMVDAGASEKSAAKEAGISRTTLRRYLERRRQQAASR